MRRPTRGTVVGIAILLAGYLVWDVALYADVVTSWSSLLFLFVPAVAGFAAAWLAPRGQLAPSVMLAIPAACFAAISRLAIDLSGIDAGFYSSVEGALRTGAFTLLQAGLFCMIGGLLAVVARQASGTA